MSPTHRPEAAMWDPRQYALFSDHRSRPFFDLLAQVYAGSPALVVDLGCGDGRLTLTLADRWPQARLIGIDSSPQMLKAARAADEGHRVQWVEQTAEEWDPRSLGQRIDVLVTNATLQWVPGHLSLLRGWVDALAADGWFAMQVPGNFSADSHRLMREVAARQPRAVELGALLDRAAAAAEPATYTTVLATLGLQVNAWETTYQHILDPEGRQQSPVLEWVRGTGLRPVLDVLSDEQERQQFLDEYTPLLEHAYPRHRFGVIFPFRRIFAVGHKSRRAGRRGEDPAYTSDHA